MHACAAATAPTVLTYSSLTSSTKVGPYLPLLSVVELDSAPPTLNQTSSLQLVSMAGTQQSSQIRAGWETLTGRSSHPVNRGEPGVTGPFSLRNSWTHWRSCSCRTSTQM